jgi:hypothetical protein
VPTCSLKCLRDKVGRLPLYIGAIDKAIADCGEGRTDAAVADSFAGREPEPALQDIDEINEVFGAPTVAEILSRVTTDLPAHYYLCSELACSFE